MMLGLSGMSGMSGQVPVVADAAAPTILTAVIANKAVADTLVATFSERLQSAGVDFTLGFSVAVGGVANVITEAVRAADWKSITFTLTSGVSQGDVVTLSYDAATGDLADVAGNVLATVVTMAVTNSVDETVPAISTAVVEDAEPFQIVIVFAEDAVATAAVTGWSVTVDAAAAVIESATLLADTLTLTMTAPILNGEVVKVIYDAAAGDYADLQGNLLAAIDAPGSAVTNNVTLVAPVVTGAEITGAALTITFNKKIVSVTSDYLGGFSVSRDGSGAGVISGARSAGQNAIVLTLVSPALDNEVFLFDYISTQGNIKDLAGNALVTIDDQAVTNNEDIP